MTRENVTDSCRDPKRANVHTASGAFEAPADPGIPEAPEAAWLFCEPAEGCFAGRKCTCVFSTGAAEALAPSGCFGGSGGCRSLSPFGLRGCCAGAALELAAPPGTGGSGACDLFDCYAQT